MKIISFTKMIFLIFLIGMNIGCDQISKNEVRENIEPFEIIEVIDKNLILTNVENTGAALSWGSNLPEILKIVILQIVPILLMIGLICFLLRSQKLPRINQMALACIIGGGIGNIIDRIKFDSVTDFVFIEIGPFKTGIFNMADVSITLGVLVIMISLFMENRFYQLKDTAKIISK